MFSFCRVSSRVWHAGMDGTVMVSNGRLWSLKDGYGLSLCLFLEKRLFYFFFLACGIQVWDVRTIMVPKLETEVCVFRVYGLGFNDA